MSRTELLMMITQLDFAALDMQLFLNTHPSDTKAIEQYNLFVSEGARRRAEFEQNYGPLNSFRSASEPSFFGWIDDPWPWERSFIKA